MKQLSLRLKHYTRDVSIVVNGNLEQRILNYLLLSFGVLGVCYVLILGSMVFNIVERRTLEHQARVLTSEVSDLELSYITLSNSIDINFSHSLGFKETETKFVTRKTLSDSSSIKLSQNEI